MIDNPAAGASGTTFEQLVNGKIVPIIDGSLIPLLYAFAFLFFMYGIARFFFSDSEEKRKEGRQFAIWGLVGFFVMFSVWGIVRVLLSALTGF